MTISSARLKSSSGSPSTLCISTLYNQRGFGGEKISFEPNDMIIVIYDVPVTIEAHKMDVWYGIAIASTTVR